MKKIVLLTFIFQVSFIAILFGQTQKVKEIKRLTNKWVEANNKHNTEMLERLYAPTVLFYGKSKDVSSCIKDKATFFKINDYTIKIDNIEIDFYKNGTIKSNFTKEESWKDVDRRKDQAYLLFEKRGKEYLIIGESDNRMDTKLNVELNIGEKVYKKSNLFNIIIGIAIALLAVFVALRFKRKKSNNDTESIPIQSNQASMNNVMAAPQTNSTIELLHPKEKGDAFENYIVTLLDNSSKRYKIKRWSSDKIATNGMSDDSNKNPDVEFEFLAPNGSTHKFAIECKWREKFNYQGNNFGLKWAEEYQMNNYNIYQRENNIPVWVAVGVGGRPDKPDNIYLIPLSNIPYSFVFETYLRNYKRKSPKHKFCYNPEKGIITYT